MPHPRDGNGIVTARRVIILVVGLFISMAGLSVCVVVLLRYFYPVAPHEPSFDIRIFTLGVMSIFAGLALIFTGDPLRVFTLIKSQVPGGRRWTDPPKETAPKPKPREEWPDIPPRDIQPIRRRKTDD